MLRSFFGFLAPAALLIAGCSDGPTGPAVCTPATFGVAGAHRSFLGGGNVTNGDTELLQTSVVPLAPFEARTFRGSELADRVWLTGGGANYLVVPQFATETGEREPVRYNLGSGGSVTMTSQTARGGLPSPVVKLDNMLRRLERRLAPVAAQEGPELRRLALSSEALAGPSLQQVGTSRTFQVLSCIPADDAQELMFETVTATLRFAGQNILIYVDNQAPSGANGLSDAVLTKLGTWFDQDLYPIGVNTFGSESDIDANDRVIVLMTPVVNGLTSRSNCGVVVAGFFFGLDLTQRANSNRGEIFYSLVPDPQGQFSCTRSVRTVEQAAPPTFVHEFQHMISFNQHVLVRRGPDEDTWLNEGLSHIAEEVAARFYENKYPPDPGNLFSDTAAIFISNDLGNSYEFLESTPTTSLTVFESTGTLAERGAAWLFLRWLADQKDELIFGRLVQTNLTSIANVENVAAEPFTALFGDWAIALWTDSIPGHPRTAVPARNRFKSRNLRQLFAGLNAANPQNFPRRYPLVPRTLGFGSTVESSMLPGTMEFFQLGSSTSDPAVGLRFARPDGQVFADALKPQLGVFRLP
jgi:hypothetical protein